MFSSKSKSSKGKKEASNDREFQMTVLYKIRRDIITNKDNEKLGEDRLQVVQYKRGEPRVEKRNYWINDEGDLKMGKLKGLLLKDFQIIDEKWEEIEQALNGKKVKGK